MMLTLGSSSAIVAHNLAALGNQVGFVSRIGDDQLGQIALDRLGASDDFNRGLHSVADCDPERRFICHFPQDDTIWSVGVA